MTSTDPKLLWHSNAPWSPTGYGAQTALFAPTLAQENNLAISAFYGLEANILPWKGIPVFPNVAVSHGNEVIRDHARVHFGGDLRGGLVVTLMDIWVLDPDVWKELDVLCWVPVDHRPLPTPIATFFYETGAIPMAMSRYGEEQFRTEGFEPLYCPHGVDTEVFRPYDRTEARREVQLPEEPFIAGMVAANKGDQPSRKCFAENFAAFKRLHDRFPDSRLYVHAEATGKFTNGVNLPHLIDAIGLDPDSVFFPDQYRIKHFPWTSEWMAKVYSSIDVLMAASAGEGFGIPTIEAQACGTPVIVSDFAASPELLGAGWKVSGIEMYTALKAFQFMPSVEEIHEALLEARQLGPEALSAKAREFALAYNSESVFTEYLAPALYEARRRFDERREVTIPAEVEPLVTS